MGDLVSVIVPTYRRNHSLSRTLHSLLDQTYTNIEIIVVDDNSDEKYCKKVNEIILNIKDFRVKYIRNSSNLGSALSRNHGIEVSSGIYVTFLDDDDEYTPDKIMSQIEFMVKNDLDYSITDLALYNEKNELVRKRKRTYIKSYDNVTLLKYHLMFHMTGTDTMMFKKSFLDEIGRFDPIDIGDEFYLIFKAIKAEGRFGYLPECNIKATLHENFGLSTSDRKIQGEKNLLAFKKNSFVYLENKEIQYIKMRYYAVVAYVYLKKRNYFKFIINSLYSFIQKPISLILDIIRLVKGET